MAIKLEVGKTYRRGNGDIRTIVRLREHPMPFVDDAGAGYAEDGSWGTGVTPDACRLVEEIIPSKTPMIDKARHGQLTSGEIVVALAELAKSDPDQYNYRLRIMTQGIQIYRGAVSVSPVYRTVELAITLTYRDIMDHIRDMQAEGEL